MIPPPGQQLIAQQLDGPESVSLAIVTRARPIASSGPVPA